MGWKSLLQPLTNTSGMHSFETKQQKTNKHQQWNAHTRKQRDTFNGLLKEVGTYFIHTINSSQRAIPNCTASEPCGRHLRIFSHWNAKPGIPVLWLSFLIDWKVLLSLKSLCEPSARFVAMNEALRQRISDTVLHGGIYLRSENCPLLLLVNSGGGRSD